MTGSIIIEDRYCGPVGMGNGGYICGLLAGFMDGPLSVSLRAPAPLDTSLDIQLIGNGVEARFGDALIATASPAPNPVDRAVPVIPDVASCLQASSAFFVEPDEMYRQCFVCGKDRGADALHIHAGPLQGEAEGVGPDIVAATWQPDADFAGDDGRVRPEIVWAALDCPGYFACSTGERSLLARMQATVFAPVNMGETYRVIGWNMDSGKAAGRKRRAATALIAPDDSVVAAARQIWVVLKS